MKYCEYKTGWQIAGKPNGESLAKFTNRLNEHGVRTNNLSQCNQALTEYVWLESGTPYFKVDDAACSLFRKINIDVPFKYVQTPLPVFAIRFTETCPIHTKFGPVKSMLMIDLSKRNAAVFQTGVKEDDQLSNIGIFALFIDCGELHPVYKGPYMNYIAMHRCDEITVQQALEDLPVKKDGSTIQEAGVERDLVSIAVSVCFLATSSDKMIKPDVLGKDLAAYLEAERKGDQDRIKIITARAHRKGKLGYIVDGEREVVKRSQNIYEGEPTGRELSYRHVRSAHFRRLHSGLVTFVRQCIVREDLPMAPIS